MKKLFIALLFSLSSLFAFENLTVDNFDEKVKNKNVIVDFYATWWYACKTLGKSLTKFDASQKEDVTIYKVDVDKEPLLAKRFKVTGVPVLVYLQNSKVIATEHGVRTPEQLRLNAINYFK